MGPLGRRSCVYWRCPVTYLGTILGNLSYGTKILYSHARMDCVFNLSFQRKVDYPFSSPMG